MILLQPLGRYSKPIPLTDALADLFMESGVCKSWNER